MKFKKYSLIFLIFIGIWCFGIISPSLFKNDLVFLLMKPFLNQVYSTTCHQIHERSIVLNGESLLVCSRCSGIYLGLLLTAIVSLFTVKSKNALILLLAASGLMILDISFYNIGLYKYSQLTALITGLFMGSASFLFLSNELAKTFNTMSNEK